MTEKTDLPSVSMANTKKELLEAYEESKERFESLSKDLLDAEKARKRLEKKVATATADAQAAPTVTAAPLPLTTAPPMQCTWPTGLVLTGGGLFALGTHRRRKCAGPSARGWPGGLRRYPPE